VSKRTGLLVVAGVLAAYLLSGSLPWVTGTSSDAVLAGRALSATGAQLAPGATALALAVAASLIALATVGPRLRYAASALLVLAALGVLVLALPPLLDPATALGRQAAELAGRAGSVVPVTAARTPAAWLGLLAAVGLPVTAGAVGWGARGWSGLSSRFERADSAPAGPTGVRRSAWDELSEGADPTGSDTPGPAGTPER